MSITETRKRSPPHADRAVDVVISNCVINLTPDKAAVFGEAFRVPRPSGRFAVSEVVVLRELPPVIRDSPAAYVSCLSGAIMKDAYLATIRAAGFDDVRIVEEVSFPLDCVANDPTAHATENTVTLTLDELRDLADSVVSIKVVGKKP